MTRGLLGRLFLRSLLIQAAWNYRGMQHLGLLWAQLPALPQEEEARRAAMARGAEFYNAHPYLCGYLLGAAAKLEALGEGEALSRLKKAALSPLGAVGDRLFWAGLRPLASALAVLGLALLAASPDSSPHGIGWAVALSALAVLAYNAVHLQWRWRALRDGYGLGLGVVQSIRGLVNHRGLAYTGAALCLLAGLMAPLLGATVAASMGLPGLLLFVVLVMVGWQLPARAWILPALLAMLGLLWLLA